MEPNSVPGEGIKGADFVFYVSAMSTDRCKKGLTVAYAAHCQQEAALDRYDMCAITEKEFRVHAHICPNFHLTYYRAGLVLLHKLAYYILYEECKSSLLIIVATPSMFVNIVKILRNSNCYIITFDSLYIF